MAWISVHESVDGPKLRRLYKYLGCSKFEAVGILNFLWFWGLNNAQKDGRVLCADKEDIGRHLFGVGAGCRLDPDFIVAGLVESGWLDDTPHGLYIHDWEVWQDQWYKAKERRENDAKRKRDVRRRGGQQSADGQEELPIGNGEEPSHDGDEGGDPPSDQPKVSKYGAEFDAFWEVYPRKIDKGEGYNKYQARRNEGYSAAELLCAAQNYALECKRKGTERQYIKHPKTFLSVNRPFLDYLPKKLPESEQADTSNPFQEYDDKGE